MILGARTLNYEEFFGLFMFRNCSVPSYEKSLLCLAATGTSTGALLRTPGPHDLALSATCCDKRLAPGARFLKQGRGYQGMGV